MKYTITGTIPTAQYQGLKGNKHGETHGMYGTPIYRTWVRMKQRCQNPNSKFYKWYGSRGITVSKDWQKFENFYRDMGDKPTPKHSLDRINNDKGYSKENCRWATMAEQGSNRRDNVNITFKGVTKNIAAWAKDLGIKHESMRKRLRKWPLEKALTQPKEVR